MNGVFWENERHTGVNGGEEFVGSDRDDGKRFNLLPAIPEAAKNERSTILQVDVDGLFAARHFLPFEETISEDHASFLAEGSAKGGFGSEGFGTGVDEAIADFSSFAQKGTRPQRERRSSGWP